jgi:hypothetical protein
VINSTSAAVLVHQTTNFNENHKPKKFFFVLLATTKNVLMICATADRLYNFMVWLSNTQPIVSQSLNTSTAILCQQYNGRVPVGGAALMKCSLPLPVSQFVIVQSSQTDALCLCEVEVYIGWYNTFFYRSPLILELKEAIQA